MAGPVKRAYSSDKRQRQAAATRRTILDAARALFLELGYANTSIQAIADEAGVAVQTVYAVFKNKRRLLDELIEDSILGDDGTPLLDRTEVRGLRSETDPRRRAELDAAMTRAITERVAPIVRIARQAAAVDPEFAKVYDDMRARRREEMLAMTRVLGPLRMKRAQAAATLYVLYSPEIADVLLGDFGWTGEQYERWLADMLYAALLRVDE